jgi:hypothetical protein
MPNNSKIPDAPSANPPGRDYDAGRRPGDTITLIQDPQDNTEQHLVCLLRPLVDVGRLPEPLCFTAPDQNGDLRTFYSWCYEDVERWLIHLVVEEHVTLTTPMVVR